jgi:hypothetical protein
MIYSSLPVYKASYDLLLEIFIFSKDFSREMKYTIGQDLKKDVIDLMVGIYQANRVYEKKEIIEKTREKLVIIRLYVRILKDLKEISLKKFTHINLKIEDVSRQLAGWQNSQQ